MKFRWPSFSSPIKQRLARVDASLAKQLQRSIERNSELAAELDRAQKAFATYRETARLIGAAREKKLKEVRAALARTKDVA